MTVLNIEWKPCSQGVIVSHPPEELGYRVLYKDWYAKRAWCEDQGWVMNKDFLCPAVMVGAKWWFRRMEDQILFTLRWS